MASGNFNLTTWYAKRIIGDASAATATDALLQTGADVTSDTWILHRTNRSNKQYGINYSYDSTSAHDKIEFYGKTSIDDPTAWIQLDTGDMYILGKMGINHAPETYSLYVDGSSYFSSAVNIDDVLNVHNSIIMHADDVDITSNSNDISQDNEKDLAIKDKNGYSYAFHGGIAKNTGEVWATIGVRNYNTTANTQYGWQGIIVKQAKDGVITYSVSTPANFRSAIDVPGLNVDNSFSGDNTFVGQVGIQGDTAVEGQLYVNSSADIVMADDGGAFVVGDKAGINIGIDGDEIHARNNKAAATLSLNYEGGDINLGSNNTSYYVNIRSTKASSSKTTGALVVGGGGGFGGTVYANAFNGPLTGNVTGNVSGVSTGVQYQNNDIDFSQADYDLLSDWSSNMCWYEDKDGDGIGRLNFVATSGGTNKISIQARRWNASSSAIGSFAGITIVSNRNNVTTCTIDGATTISGDITADGYINLKHGTIDLTQSDNGLSSNADRYMQVLDKNNYDFALFQGVAKTDGSVYAFMGVNNRTTGGTALGWKGISINQTKSSTDVTYNVASPGNFRSAISAPSTSGENATGTWGINISGNSNTATFLECSYSSGSIDASTWSHGKTGRGDTKIADVWGQKWTVTGQTYTPSGGSATNLTDAGDLVIFLSKSDTSNQLNTNIVIDGNMYATTFVGDLSGQLTRSGISTAWNKGRDNALVKTTSINGYSPWGSIKTTNGSWDIGAYNDNSYLDSLIFSYVADGTSTGQYSGSNYTPYNQILFKKDGTVRIANTVDSYNPTCLELWRGSNCSWEIINDSGVLHFKNNYTTAVQSSYTQDSMSIAYNTGNVTISGTITANGGILTLYREGTTANDYPAGVLFSNKDTTTGKTYSGAYVYAYQDHGSTPYGHNLVINSGGNTAIGAGESAGALYSAVLKNNTGENMYVLADGNTYIYANANTVANRIGFAVNTSGNIIPYKAEALNNNLQTIGASNAKWANIYATAFTGDGAIMSGTVAIVNNTQNNSTYNALLYVEHKSGNDWGIIINKNSASDYGMQILCTSTGSHGLDVTGRITGTKVYNAVWNDYAECRNVESDERGYCVTETPSGQMVKTTQRLQAGCKITSDTFGTCMGETKEAKTPIAVSGRVLVYPYRTPEEYPLGAAVCSAPGGTVDIMTRDEIMMYPERIVGTVSEIPNYEIWCGGEQDGLSDIPVNGRIWIYVR